MNLNPDKVLNVCNMVGSFLGYSFYVAETGLDRSDRLMLEAVSRGFVNLFILLDTNVTWCPVKSN